MVEGHQCHRVAAAHRKLLVGKSFQARSPNGRFKEGAAAINAKPLTRIEVHGKNLFYFFGGEAPQQPQTQQALQPEVVGTPAEAVAAAAAAAATTAATPDAPRRPSRATAAAAAAAAAGEPAPAAAAAVKVKGKRGRAAKDADEAAAGAAAAAAAAAAAGAQAGGGDVVVMHVHFGMSGAFRTMELPGLPPTDTTRLELLHKGAGLVAHLSAMTVAHGGVTFYGTKAAALGQDPLREDADKEVLWAKVQKSKKPIGLVLMDQTLIAGVGNIYRAEILYKARVHPEAPAASIRREQFDRIWYHCVDLLQRGFVAGSIITVDPQDAAELGKPWTRRYIYNQKSCGRCKGPVRTWDMAGRTVYCCETCQPLNPHKAAGGKGTGGAGSQAAGARGAKKGRGAGGSGSAGAGNGNGKVIGESESDEEREQGEGEEEEEEEEVQEEVQIAPARRAAMAAARTGRVFVSHCAPDDPADVEPAKLTVKLLKERLIALNLDTRGAKPQLVARLEAALRWQQPGHDHDPAKATKAQEEEEEEAGGAEEGAAAGAAAAAPSTPQAAPQSKRARGEGAAAAGAEEEGKAAKDGAGAGGGGGDGDSDSAVTLDRAEQALADSMAPPAVEAAAATGAVAGGAADAGSDPADALRRHSVAQLRLELQRRGLPSSGVKATLVQRLAAAMAGDGAAAAPAAAAPAAAAPAPAAAAEAAEAEPEPQSPVAMAVAAVADEDSPALRTPVAQTTAPAAPMGPRKGPRPAEPQSVQTPTIAAGGVNGAASAAAAAVAAAAGLTAAATTPSTVEGPAAAPQAAAAATSLSSARSKYDITPGIQGLKMASAKDAAFEKLLAGENRAVEHVALEDDEVVDLLSAYPVPSTRKRARALQELEQQQQ